MTDINEQINQEVKVGEVAAYDFVSAALKELKETYGSEIPDMSSKEGYTRSKQIAGEMTKLRTSLEAKRKEIKSPALAYGKMIDSEAKRLAEEIKSIEEPHKSAYKEYDAEKKQRKEAFEQRLLDVKNLPTTCFDKTPEQIEEMIDDLSCVSVDKETFGHKLQEAQDWVPSILTQLSGEHNKAIERKLEEEKRIAEQEELAKLRREAAEREQIQRHEQLKREQEERERQIAENARIEAEQRAEREKQEAIEVAERAEQARIQAEENAKREAEEAAKQAEINKQIAIEAEMERQRQEQLRIEAEAKAREEDKQHRATINNQALQCFVNGGLSEKQAKLAVTLIASRQVDNVNINY